MPTMMSALSLRIARPLAVAALLAVFGLASLPSLGSARADEAISPPAEEMVLVPAKTMQSLEQRVIFLEETVTALTESWQHIDTHRVCAIDEDTGAETCITKRQLDSLLLHNVYDNHAAIVDVVPQETAKAEETGDKAEPVEATTPAKQSDASGSEAPASEIAVAETPVSQPSETSAIVASESSSPAADPETTGSVKPAITGAAVLSFPHVEIYEEPVARTEE